MAATPATALLVALTLMEARRPLVAMALAMEALLLAVAEQPSGRRVCLDISISMAPPLR